MKSLIVVLTLSVFFPVFCYSQSELNNDSTSVSTQNNSKIESSQSEIKNTVHPENATSSESVNKADLSKAGIESAVQRLNLYVPEFYVGPLSNPNKIPTTFILESEYNFQNYQQLNNKALLYTSSSLNIYPGLGANTTISGMVHYKMTDWWSVGGGSYVSKYSIYGNQFNDIGFNGNMSFRLNDRFRLNTFGQYSVYGNKKHMVGGNFPGMFPQSNYGGSFEYKINDKFGIEAGMVRELDPMTGKWKNRPFIAPVFYK